MRFRGMTAKSSGYIITGKPSRFNEKTVNKLRTLLYSFGKLALIPINDTKMALRAYKRPKSTSFSRSFQIHSDLFLI